MVNLKYTYKVKEEIRTWKLEQVLNELGREGWEIYRLEFDHSSNPSSARWIVVGVKIVI